MIVNRRTTEIDNIQRRFTEVLPDTVTPGAPLVLFLHGSLQSGSVARNFTGNTFDALTERGCVVFYPDGIHRHFNDHRVGFQEKAREMLIDDTAFLSRLIDLSAGEYATDRVIACGFSNGGQMVQRFALERPGILDGIACFGSPWPAEDNVLPELAEKQKDWVATPVLSVQGTADPIVPYNGGTSGIGNANRGTARSAIDSARHFAALNGLNPQQTTTGVSGEVRVERFGSGVPGTAANGPTVELWSIEGVGHLVPSPKQLDAKIGPGTDKVVGAKLVSTFFKL
ncbi:PHB depolymerase family esterase [Corynebacterium sp. p3-SID1194]|uniref:alpha/beta hydrolase family esterase n=1 Tax=Corynebacterium sp. p3-SID1194 TaxID=2916105 RepID=UPI0021A5F998|nr:dienelactone hydrolase family protein [Corynebacterium sp. p3-SID1194]MCT1450729.1 dienelactone hydrolase family protein [Corynebacterium sp. p3-SID1194]